MSGSAIQSELAYVRLASGEVAQLEQGSALPDDVAEGEVERLTVAGVFGEPQASEIGQPGQQLEQGSADPTPVAEDDKPPRGRRS